MRDVGSRADRSAGTAGARCPAAQKRKRQHRANMPRSVVSVNLRLTPVILNRYCTVRLIGC